MFDLNYTVAQCTICKHEYTSTHFEAMPGVRIYVCEICLEEAKDNFIWVCLNCGNTYFRPKKIVMERTNGYGVRGILQLSNGSQLIQGVLMCIRCNPEGIIDFVMKQRADKERELEAAEARKRIAPMKPVWGRPDS